MDINQLEETLGITIPEEVRHYVDGLSCEVDKVGRSESVVAIFENYILKVSSLSFDIDNELRTYRALKDKLPIPDIVMHAKQDGRIYLLKTKIKGKMLCDDYYMKRPHLLYRLARQALDYLWAVDVCDLDIQNTIDTVLSFGQDLQKRGLLDIARSDRNITGEFSDFDTLLEYLMNNRPQEEVALCHGDLCLTNIICHEDKVVGFIDLGLTGISGRHHDVAILSRSIRYNYAGVYGKAYPGYDEEKLYRALGLPKDEAKERYYLLLDEVLG